MKIVQLHEDNKIKETLTLDEIYIDDTIDVVKKKIIGALREKIAYEELYLFAKKRKLMSKRQAYNELSQNTNVIPRTRLRNFLSNIVSHNIAEPAEDTTIDIDTIMGLNIKDEETVMVPIGMDMNATYKFPFAVNPLLVTDFDDIVLSNSAHEMTSTYNRNLLLNYGDLEDNTIYIVSAEDAMSHLKDEHVFQIYYPFLFKKDITTREQLLSSREKLIEANQREVVTKTQENIALLREIHKEKTVTKYIQKGITEISFVMRPATEISIPIDVIFKLVKTSMSVPFIKYNPGKKREKMYRLFANKSTINGKKIPYLTKSKLAKLANNIAREKSVGIYLDADGVTVIAEFDTDANLKVTITMDAAQTLDAAAKITGEKLNPVLEQINTFIEQSGYSYKYFDRFDDGLVEIVNMKYIEYFEIDKPFLIEKYMKCLKSVFSVSEGNLIKGIEMDYKRVDYYVEGSKIEKFIRRLMVENRNADEITSIVSENFDVTPGEARDTLLKILNQTTTEQNVFANKRFKKQGNAGFTTIIKRDQFSGNVMIEVANINAVGYLDVIPIYLDALVKLTQGHASQELEIKCIGDVEEEEQAAHDDIKSPPEQPLPDRKDIEINPDNGLITQDSEKDEFIDDFFGESDLEDLSPEEEKVPSPPKAKQKTPSPPKAKPQKEKEQSSDIDGMPLNNPNFFFSRMQQRDARLFLTKDDGKYKAYSRMCPHNMLRQPVILTDEEKERIDKEHSGSYTNAVKYGSSPDKQNWYICPRYWSIKDNVSLTEEDVKSGKYGGIIPPGSKKVPKGKYIFEFNVGTKNNEHIDEQGNYITHYPGFLKDDTHPEGMCVPCCFKQWDSKMQQTRREQCMKPEVAPQKQKQAVRDDYIKEPNKYPLKQGAYGYLPMTIQKLLNSNNEKCQVSKKDKSLKPSIECLLRKGVENSNSQSFLACLADAYSYSEGLPKIPSIDEMKQIIIEKITIDVFVMLQNGNLTTIFEKDTTNINYEKYKKSDFYKRLIKSNKQYANKDIYFRRTCMAYENFIDFIKDPTIVIDYTYLWDFVCRHLFSNRINLVVMNIVENDLTDNVEIICPTDVYSRSSAIYNARYKTLLIVKRETMYEPVYLIETDAAGNTGIREKFFNVYSTELGASFKNALVDIRSDMLKCAPYDSKPEVYQYKRNLSFNAILSKIKDKKEYSVKYQVINYNSKTIGLILSYKDEKTGYIPCEPSYIHPQYEIKSMDEDIYNDYKSTYNFLKFIHKELKLPCKPYMKFIEEGAVVGILTETNQVVPLSHPNQNLTKDNLIEVMAHGIDVKQAETEIARNYNGKQDEKREKVIKRIRLETNFYNTFRNTVRIFLSKYENRTIKKKINAIIDEPNTYVNKITMLTEHLHELMDGHVDFVSYETLNIDKIDKVLTCGKDCGSEKRSYCITKEGNKCVLLIPKKNLISESNNKTIYFQRMADELIRYKNIREYLLTEGTFLIIEQLDYDLHKDEIVLLHDLLFKEYIESGELPVSNPYIKHNTHNDAQPSERVVSMEEKRMSDRTAIAKKIEEKSRKDDDVPLLCKIEKTELGAHDKLYKFFHTKTTNRFVVKHEGHVNCGYEMISKIITDFTKKQMEINELKKLLIELYKKDWAENEDLYVITMRNQGKKDIVKTMVSNNVTLNTLIASDNYYSTNIDLFLIAKHFKLPIVIASGTRLKENKQMLMTINYDDNNAFYYVVKQHGIVNNEVQRYSLLMNENEDIRISINDFTQTTKNAIKDNTIEDGFVTTITK